MTDGQRLTRVAVGSLGAALLLGAGYLGVQSVLNARLQCEGPPDTAECAFTLTTARELARMQALSSAGCALVGVGVLVFTRSLRQEDPT